MCSPISKYYSTYLDDLNNFDRFHNEVINMPRASFSGTSFQEVRGIAAYLLLLENDSVSNLNYKEMMGLLSEKVNIGIYPEKYRSLDFEERYLAFEDLNTHYNNSAGRMFRHIMGTAAFYGLIISKTKTKKNIVFSKCREYYLAPDEVLAPLFRNDVISFNAKSNDFIRNLEGITITKETNYRVAFCILS